MADFTTILMELSETLDRQQIQAPLFGGFVLPVYGVERLTLDMDFLLAAEDLEPFTAILERLGYQRVFKSVQYAKFSHGSDHVLDIDTVFTSKATIESITATASRQKVLGVAFNCVSLNIMIGTKLHAIRYNEVRRGQRDFDDIVELMRANHIEPDGDLFRRLCGKYGTETIHQRLREAMLHD